MPATTPRFPLTLPEPGEDHLGPWRTRYLRRCARTLLDEPGPMPGWLAHTWAGVRGELAAVLAARPGPFYGALLLPQVAGPLHAGRLDEALPTLLLELARARTLGRELWWGGPVSRLLSPPLGVGWALGEVKAGMVFRDGEVEVAPGRVWGLAAAAGGDPSGSAPTGGPGVGPEGPPAFHRLRHGGWLGLVDNNPLAMMEAHPDKEGNTLSLGTAPLGAWLGALDAAREAVAEGLPALAAEHRQLLATVIPVGGPSERSLSASYQEAPGLVYLSLHPSRLTMAEALVHEVQHGKLNLVAHVDPLLEDAGQLYTSPVRPDPRPLWGVLLAVHAFVPVEALHDAWAAAGHPVAREEGFATRREQVRALNREGWETLRTHARPTEAGARLLEGLGRALG